MTKTEQEEKAEIYWALQSDRNNTPTAFIGTKKELINYLILKRRVAALNFARELTYRCEGFGNLKTLVNRCPSILNDLTQIKIDNAYEDKGVLRVSFPSFKFTGTYRWVLEEERYSAIGVQKVPLICDESRTLERYIEEFPKRVSEKYKEYLTSELKEIK